MDTTSPRPPVAPVMPEDEQRPINSANEAHAQEREANARVLYYDEVFAEDGRVRPPYEAAVRFLRRFPRRFSAKFPAKSRRLTGDTPLTAMPRILGQSEYTLLVRGTEQRARALHAFYEDHLGEQTFRDRIVPGHIVDTIVERSGEGLFRRALSERARRQFRAFFGPDIVRAGDGRFYVLEDNIHYLGGPGDLEPARAAHEKLLPGFAEAIGAINDPRAVLDELVSHFYRVAEPPIGPGPDQGAFVVYGAPPYDCEEDLRLYRMLEARHAIIVEPEMKDKRIKIESDGAYLVQRIKVGNTTIKYRKKIGFLWLNAEHTWVDWEHPAIREKALLDEAREHLHDEGLSERSRRRLYKAMRRDPATRRIDLERLRRALERSNLVVEGSVLKKRPKIPGLLDLVLEGSVQTNATPGIEFLADKMFYSYVPDLIRYYLKEEPILQNVPTHRLFDIGEDGSVVARRDFITEVMKNRARYVIKVADGRGGDGVYLGPKMTKKKWRKLEKRLLEEPTRYVVQDFVHPSVLSGARGEDRRIVDNRLIAMLIDGQIVVTGTFWGRSNVLVGGDGKMNLSLSGMETVGYVVPDPIPSQG
ncbi:circularly permuted type 2 ATP-grasp protein [Polyangium sp. y55x31]|uniref:circularly permuted type 2 ATP-grasp protein n=1 Tax=Polyangium sp. y55x31 TaxID=3042688 RepID=UPI0024821165|nr:circularly permuted type 2 ATP-grasp protein [Polyangium sp. y55x31]MDI1479184.1 circularly permuted type 2 ATP-grasp protein [Polyangium sp. y55x31]